MTTQAANAAPTQTPYVFWLVAWHNLPIPTGEPICCRITRAALEIDLTPAARWSIPLHSIATCERHLYHDGIAGIYLYAHLTIDTVETTTGALTQQEVFLGALDPISQTWDWTETLNLIKLINDLRQHATTTMHTNPYYRALERQGRLADFAQIAYTWDAEFPPSHYARHPLLQEMRRRSFRAVAIPLLFVLVCVLLGALLWWLEASHWIILNSVLGLFSFALASFWPHITYRHFPSLVHQVSGSLTKEATSKLMS